MSGRLTFFVRRVHRTALTLDFMGRAKFLESPSFNIPSWSIRLANLIRCPAGSHPLPLLRSFTRLARRPSRFRAPASLHPRKSALPQSRWRKLKVSSLRLTGRCSGPNSHDLLPSFVYLVFLVSPVHSAGCRAAKLFSLGVSPLVIVIRNHRSSSNGSRPARGHS